MIARLQNVEVYVLGADNAGKPIGCWNRLREYYAGTGRLDPQLRDLWPVADQPPGRKAQLIALIAEAQKRLVSGNSLCA